ncbi:glutathione S-transferase domain-containing protein, partial [mine drainage metagenome]
MSELPVLVIGDKTYSSWSLRPWLLLRQAGIAFEERLLWLHRPEFRNEVARYSPSGRVPALLHDGAVIWESLAILEYINETWLQGRGWPSERKARAQARAIACEMHSGFAALRRDAVAESAPARRRAARPGTTP